MQWNTSYTESVHTFANTINTHEGGTHEEGFRAALTTLVNKFGEDWGYIKKKEDRPLRRRRTRRSDRDHLDQARRAAVRGPDQDQARQHRGQVVRADGRPRPARRVVREEPHRGQGHRPQGAGGDDRADGCAQGARAGPRPQGSVRRGGSSRQAHRLLLARAGGVRDLRRRGRQRRRLRAPCARPADAGDPADPRQDPQRREGPDRQGPAEQRGPGAHLGARHRCARRVRHRQAALLTSWS